MSLYSGIALPWGTTISSVIEPKTDTEMIKSSVIWIVLTGLGERVMRPTFGSLLPTLFCNPADTQTMSRLRGSVQEALTQWEPRVSFVDFSATKVGNNMLACKVIYKIIVDKARQEQQIAEFTLSEGMLAGG